MSLNKSLDRFFDEIRREAKRNPDFANRLDAVMRAHGSRRDVSDDLVEEVSREESEKPVLPPAGEVSDAKRTTKAATPQAEAPAASPFNPVGLYQQEGEDALAKALEGQGLPGLMALVKEHNLDPTGEAADLDREALVAHVIAQAKRRAERDAKLFDY